MGYTAQTLRRINDVIDMVAEESQRTNGVPGAQVEFRTVIRAIRTEYGIGLTSARNLIEAAQKVGMLSIGTSPDAVDDQRLRYVRLTPEGVAAWQVDNDPTGRVAAA